MMVNGWFPRINNRGDIVSGDTSLYVTAADGSQFKLAHVGGYGDWHTDDEIVFNSRDGHTKIITADGLTIRRDFPVGYNAIRANRLASFAGFIAAGTGRCDVYVGGSQVDARPASTCPRWSGANFAYLTPYLSTFRSLRIGNGEVLADSITEFDCDNIFNVAIIATGTYTRKLVGTPTLQDDETWVIVEDGWALTISTKGGGLLIRPVGAVAGYRLIGDWYYPHFRLLNGVLVIAASSGQGDLKVQRINTLQVREDLRVPVALPPVPPIIPPPIVQPPPTQGKPMKINRAAKSAIDEFITAFAIPHGAPEESYFNILRAYMRRMAEYIKFRTGDVRWGVKSNGPSAPQGKDALAYDVTPLLIWDILGGSGTGSPTLIPDPDSVPFNESAAQTFIAVNPVDHVHSGSGGGGAGGPGPEPGGGNGGNEGSNIANLQAQIDQLRATVAQLAVTALHSGDKVALRAVTGQYLCVEDGYAPAQQNQFVIVIPVDQRNVTPTQRPRGAIIANRGDVGEWETLVLEKK